MRTLLAAALIVMTLAAIADNADIQLDHVWSRPTLSEHPRVAGRLLFRNGDCARCTTLSSGRPP
jgi:hypothetical protein